MFFKISGGEFPGCPPCLRVCRQGFVLSPFLTIVRMYIGYTVSAERSRLPYVFWWNWCCLRPVNTVNMHLVDFLVCVWSSWNENKHWNDRDIMLLQKPKPVYTPSKRQRTTEGRKVQVPWGGIHEWPKAEQRYLYTDWLSKHSITWASSLCHHRTGAFKHRKPVSF